MPRCQGCHADWPELDGPTHRYIGASAACWHRFSSLQAGVPAVRGARLGSSLIDAYCTQHPGEPSPQSIQSVAVHLVALSRRLDEGIGAERLIPVRTAVVEAGRKGIVAYRWLSPPPEWTTTILDVVETAVDERGTICDALVVSVFAAWMSRHAATIQEWSAANRRILPG